MDRLVHFGHGVPLSVVDDDLHILCTVGPTKADPPLLVDSYAVLAFPVSFQLLYAVAGRDPEATRPIVLSSGSALGGPSLDARARLMGRC